MRVATVVLSLITAYVAYRATSIVGVFKFLIAFGSGTGLVYLVRWYWWRVNAWSEISAMLASTAVSITLYQSKYADMPFYEKLFLIISISTVIWVAVTFLTKPTDEAKLIEFYKRAAPGGPGWKYIENKVTGLHIRGGKTYTGDVIHFTLGTIMVYGYTLGLGKILLGHSTEGVLARVGSRDDRFYIPG